MEQQINEKLYNALKIAADKISQASPQMGVYAQRKISAVSANSDLQVLIQVGEDLEVIARRITGGTTRTHTQKQQIAGTEIETTLVTGKSGRGSVVHAIDTKHGPICGTGKCSTGSKKPYGSRQVDSEVTCKKCLSLLQVQYSLDGNLVVIARLASGREQENKPVAPPAGPQVAKKQTFQVSLPTGERRTRMSSHNYTHAVAILYSDQFYALMRRGTWDVLSWHETKERAETALSRVAVGDPGIAKVLIVEASPVKRS